MSFTKENAAEFGRRGVEAKRRQPRDLRAFAERVMTDPKVQASILRQARAGKLQPQVVALLTQYAAGKPQAAAPPPPPPPSRWNAETYGRLAPQERRWMLALTRKAMGRPTESYAAALADLPPDLLPPA